MKPKRELLRVVRSPEGEISLDLTGKNEEAFFWSCPLKEDTLKLHHCVQRNCEETEKVFFEDVLVWRDLYTLSSCDRLFIEELTGEDLKNE